MAITGLSKWCNENIFTSAFEGYKIKNNTQINNNQRCSKCGTKKDLSEMIAYQNRYGLVKYKCNNHS